MLVSEIVNRAQSEAFHASQLAYPRWDTVATAISDTTTLTLVTAGRVANLPDSAVLEFDNSSMELALNKSTAGATATLQERGFLESTAGASHPVGTRVLIQNPFPRIVIFNALITLIRSLRAFGIYSRAVDTSATLSTTAPVALNSSAYDTAGDIWYKTGQRWQRLRKSIEYEVLYDISPLEVQFWVGMQGASLRLPYKKDFVVPTALTSDLTATGLLSDSLQTHLPKGIAAMLLSGQEVSRAHSEHIKNALEREGRPIGALTSIARNLNNEWLNGVILERQRLSLSDPITIEYAR